MTPRPVYATTAEADAALPRCPRPCSECSPGHHWYLEYEGGEDDSTPFNDALQACICKHCGLVVLIDEDAEDLPEV